MQCVDGLVAEAADADLDEAGAHHALGQAWLPSLVDQVAAVRRLKVQGQPFEPLRLVPSFRFAAALRAVHVQPGCIARRPLDAPDADAAVPPVLLEHAGTERQPRGQLDRQLREAVHAVHVAAERQVAGLDQHVLDAKGEDGVSLPTVQCSSY